MGRGKGGNGGLIVLLDGTGRGLGESSSIGVCQTFVVCV